MFLYCEMKYSDILPDIAHIFIQLCQPFSLIHIGL